MLERLRIRLGGAVQGVGFRPFVYRLATQLGLHGYVDNTSSGLHVEVEGPRAVLQEFITQFESGRPPLARVLTREIQWLPPSFDCGFRIVASEAGASPTAAILPDLAPCPDCLREMDDENARRRGYAFTNCTACGPRFSIILDLPYDRPNTTMRTFELCEACRQEYASPDDRRFHAQPIACPACGPRLSASLEAAAAELRAGRIVALKGVGGYQLLVDASNESAVARLRERKHREWKPFALLMSDLEEVAKHASIKPLEAELLLSQAAPIVLLRARIPVILPRNVCGHSPWIGVMLPASPLHRLLFSHWQGPLVATSGNLSDEPIAIGVEEAHERLGGVADLFVDHDRPIARPCDDSVVRISQGRTMSLRRARGYSPTVVPLSSSLPRILAVGGHLKNTVGIATGAQAILSQHIGDLDTPESRTAFERTIDDLSRLYRFTPELITCDLHPDYYPTRWAEESGIPLLRVQHHEAHAASCIAENNAHDTVLAVVWDGAGYGSDGTIWGGEFFLVEGGRMERVAHLMQFPLAGGDSGARECVRSLAGLRHRAGLPVDGPLGPILRQNVGCVETSSVGRLFDAVASLTGLAERNRFEGEAGLCVEASAWRAPRESPYSLKGGDWREMLSAMLTDVDTGVSPGTIAARFHFALADWVEEVAVGLKVRQVALSGGCFQNAFLSSAVAERIETRGISLLTHQIVPPNDGGLCLGQLVLAGQAPP